MRIYQFGPDVSKLIHLYDSRGLRMSPLARVDGPVRVDIMHIEPDGIVGAHEAFSNQLFAVVHGSGWVRSGDDPAMSISVGQAAFWTTGEFHESGSVMGMTVIVIEGDAVNPEGLLSATGPAGA